MKSIHCKDKMPKLKQIFPEKEYRGLSPKFMCLWANYIFRRWIWLFCWRKYVDRSWEYINRSQTHKCKNWGWGHAIPRKGIYTRNCRCSVGNAQKALVFFDSATLYCVCLCERTPESTLAHFFRVSRRHVCLNREDLRLSACTKTIISEDCAELVFLNLLRSPGIDSQPGWYDNPIWRTSRQAIGCMTGSLHVYKYGLWARFQWKYIYIPWKQGVTI